MDIIGFIGEITVAIFKHGWSATTLVVFIFALFKFTPFRRMVMRRLPKWLRKIDSNVNDMKSDISRIESKVDALLGAGGITWDAPLSDGNDASRPTNGRRGWWMLQRAAMSPADTATSSTVSTDRIYRSQKWWRGLNMNKLKSRKFWMAVVAGLLVVLNDGLDLGIAQDTVIAFAGIIASYIFGEAAADVAKAKTSGFDDTKTH